MLSRCLEHFEEKGRVKLSWVITNKTDPPHYHMKFDSGIVDTMPFNTWCQAFASQETVKTLMHWIHLNVLVSDAPPEPIEKPYVSVVVLERISFKSLVDIYTQVHDERCSTSILRSNERIVLGIEGTCRAVQEADCDGLWSW